MPALMPTSAPSATARSLCLQTHKSAPRPSVVGSTVRLVVSMLATGYCVTRFLAEPILLQGPSMEPTIEHNDVIIAEKYSSTFGRNQYRRGDIVVARSPLNPNTLICKRIAALAGDPVKAGFFAKPVPKGHVWLLGDNRANSTDSREFGAIPVGLIVGRVAFRVWPVRRIDRFQSGSSP